MLVDCSLVAINIFKFLDMIFFKKLLFVHSSLFAELRKNIRILLAWEKIAKGLVIHVKETLKEGGEFEVRIQTNLLYL